MVMCSQVGIAVAPECHQYLKENFSDFLSSYSQVQSIKVRELLSQQKLDHPTYLTLYVPALDWILQCVARRGTEADFVNMLFRCRNTRSLSHLLISTLYIHVVYLQ
ncbi:C16orf62 [Cordylochernes scorpioides]|uniref:C16orf62 n=1 Tax=Cordylochernes scorpioides TaxID=51811 RepID=A0ABY6LM05_9ARAC|nr:C16orf62 [Cordylochernes scorpioides]